MADHKTVAGCRCFEEVLEQAKDELAKGGGIPGNAREITAQWEHGILILSGGRDHCPVKLPVRVEYRLAKQNGEHYPSKVTRRIDVAPSYCPFCGRQYGPVDKL